ncbi:MAG: hypothetical protein ACRC0X_07410 [Brevinema sp.]
MKNTDDLEYGMSLDSELKSYYEDHFAPSTIKSESKTRLLHQIEQIDKRERYWKKVVGYVSAAALIGVASYVSANYLIESKIERNIPFVD